MSKRDIGKEILAGLDEIAAWRKGGRKLKTTRVELPQAAGRLLRCALAVLRDAGFNMPSSCELGVCGACECGYRAGTVIHRDVVLEPAARRDRMMPCVSRAAGRVVLAL